MSQIPCKDRTFRREDQIFFAKKPIFEQNGYFFVSYAPYLCTLIPSIFPHLDVTYQMKRLVYHQALLNSENSIHIRQFHNQP